MQRPEFPIVHDIVLVGGGHAHALVAGMWAMAALPGVRLTLINPGPAAPYTGMLPGFVAGHYRRDEIMIDLVTLARRAGARVILDTVTGIDRDQRRLHLASRPPLPYDVASIDIGITSDVPDLLGFAEHGLAAKPLGHFAEKWEAFATAPRNKAAHVAVIGGGVGGVELALAVHHRLSRSGPSPQITIVERGPVLMPMLPSRMRDLMERAITEAGVSVRLATLPVDVTASTVRLNTGEQLRSDLVLAVAGARPQAWLEHTGLGLSNGFIAVDRHLRSSDPSIFAAGDCAELTYAPRPKAGVYAVRAAPVLLQNLRATITGSPLRGFDPQGDYLKLVSLGDRQAVGEKWGLTAKGAALWRQKDRIDRKFMAKFTQPAPKAPAPPPSTWQVPGLVAAIGDKPLCGGCGAKLGPAALSAALSALPARTRPDVLRGAGDDAAVLHHASGFQVITTDHLRAFTQDARLMARLAAIHALGDVWAMGADPQVALSQVVLPRLSDAKATEMLAEITAAAAEVFAAEGADLVGGHSSIGAELTVGFTVTGLTRRTIDVSGAQIGDALILTKPIGTGTILAAEMAGKTVSGLILGEAVAQALASMARPQGSAARILAPHAHAMTDVTGFGLAGHLLQMLSDRGLSADLNADLVPVLPGALALASAGLTSSLAPANLAAISGLLDMQDGPLRALMVDPQTCGGLLAAVPLASAAGIVAELQAAGFAAVMIGQVQNGPIALRVH